MELPKYWKSACKKKTDVFIIVDEDQEITKKSTILIKKSISYRYNI